MTRERAIEVLDRWCGFGHPDEEYARVNFEANINEVEEAHYMAIAALREQEERSKGCEFCNEKNVAVMSASILTFDLKHHGCTCRFCPMCGRKLGVEG